jgi:pimeloyl-ACP methyl ester carboxylesterase
MYSRAAQFHDGHRNPVIVIPGILGSRLTDRRTDRVLWGTVGFHTANPAYAEDAQALALPMRPGVPLSQLQDESRADAILGDVQIRLLGFPLQVAVYHEILRTLGIGGYRNDRTRQATLSSIDYGDDHYTCFEFHYDWRRSNDENAARLAEFIREKTEYVSEIRRVRYGVVGEQVRFDIVAHSMGGLLARYYLRYGDQPLAEDGSLPALTWAGAKSVETLIMVATPNAGSVDSFKALVEGAKHNKFVPRYPAAVVGTMPSFYQLMPRMRHGAVVNCLNKQPIDLYDAQNWLKYEWGLADPREDPVLKDLLPHSTPAARRQIAIEHLQKSLTRARQFHMALDIPSPPPPGTSIYLIAGDVKNTNATIEVCNVDGGLQVVRQDAGDGTVLRSSALMDERLSPDVPWRPRLVSPISFHNTTFLFADHLGLTSDAVFTDNVLHLLLERQRPATPAAFPVAPTGYPAEPVRLGPHIE